jgi:hypothetical protein
MNMKFLFFQFFYLSICSTFAGYELIEKYNKKQDSNLLELWSFKDLKNEVGTIPHKEHFESVPISKESKKEYKEKLKRLIGKGKLRRKCIKAYKYGYKKMPNAKQVDINKHFFESDCDIEHILACGETFPANIDKTVIDNKTQREACLAFEATQDWTTNNSEELLKQFQGGGNIAEIAKLIKLESTGTCNDIPTKKGCYAIYVNKSSKKRCYIESPLSTVPKESLEKNGYQIKKKNFIVHFFYCVDKVGNFPSNEVFLGYCQLNNINKGWAKDCIKDTSPEAQTIFDSWKNNISKSK